MLIQFRQAKRRLNTEQAKQHLTDTVVDIFADRPRIDLLLAIGAGHRALERGEPFFDAVAISEGVLMVWTEAVERMHDALIARRNRERLAEWRNKHFATKGE